MISHGTVPKIFHFINRAGGGGGGGKEKTWLGNVGNLHTRSSKLYAAAILLSVASREDRAAVNLCEPRSSTAIQTTPPVIPFVSPCFGAPLPPESIPLIPPRPRSLSPFRGGPGSNIRPVSMLFYESRRNLVNISIRKTVNKNRPLLPSPVIPYRWVNVIGGTWAKILKILRKNSLRSNTLFLPTNKFLRNHFI